MKNKLSGSAASLWEKLELPQETLPGRVKLTVTAGRRALIENHRGILSFDEDRVAVRTFDGRLEVLGGGLRLLAMDRREVLIGGQIERIDWG